MAIARLSDLLRIRQRP